MSRKDTEGTLNPYHDLILSCILDAWRECQANLSPIMYKLNSCAIANVVFSLMTSNVRERFEGVEGAKIVIKNRMFVLSIKGVVAVRFRKLGKNRLPRGARTQQSIDFVNQVPTLPGMPTQFNVFAGYQLNILETDIQGVFIVCPDGKGIDWYYPIDASAPRNVVDVSERNAEIESERGIGLKPEFKEKENKRGEGSDGGNE